MNLLDILARTTTSFVVLLILTRLLGKKQLSQLTYFNYTTGITIGSIAAIMAMDRSRPLSDGLTSLVFWSLLTLLVGWISLKSAKLRILFDGEPTIVIKKGEILEKSLSKLQLSMDDLSMLLRNQKIFSINEIDYAILEPNGVLSVLKKVNHQTASKQDVHTVISKPKYIPSEIIVDGKIIMKNLNELNLTPEWLNNQLTQTGIKQEDIFYAEIQSDGSLFIDKNESNN
ncbi:DUF421 domain-containing protein [Hazenella coriacea]|uniref:Uncharacterized membrane protein YcaP (DUF421 family) n=1 Tax=Hazenella coriacea TaxID=1179467 RepID=A0A4V6NZ75_9BACL|nr:DUF421 domain-containing protein [Hazenella coriacea]TCS93177.1 uncharacterized membrane protein YcaP (DUF421 family) [Hazenella coriacea]